MTLKERLAGPRPVVAPGVFDPLSALLAEQAGFDAAYLSGASVSYTRLGRPDVGLVSAAEVVDTVARVADRVGIPLIVDADTGFGNALNVIHTVRALERAGAAAIQIEDQQLPKRCGHLRGKTLVSIDEMVGKVAAAVDARAGNTLIVARTDAIAVEGFEEALRRAEAYLQAGADVLFVEAPRSLDEMRTIAATFGERVPLLANMVEGGRTPVSSADDLGRLGFRLVITPGSLARAMAFAGAAMLDELKRTGATAGYQDRMFDFDQLNARLGLKEALATGDAYADPAKKAAE